MPRMREPDELDQGCVGNVILHSKLLLPCRFLVRTWVEGQPFRLTLC